MMDLKDFREWSEVRITGTSSSPHGMRFANLYCMVATNSCYQGENAIKVWPMEMTPELEKSTGGKIWFEGENVESIEMVLHNQFEGE